MSATTTLPTAAERASMTWLEIRAIVIAQGETISEFSRTGPLVLRRPDFSVGEMPDSLYIVWPGNAVAMRKLMPSLPDQARGQK